MSINIIGEDIKLMRVRYNEALKMQGIPARYQYPILPDTNVQGESVIDSYSIPEDVYIFFEGSPKLKTFKRVGWVVENEKELPFLIHCSFDLKNLQRDCIFKISGQYTELPERTFKVTEISYDLQAADHLICQVIPVYDKQTVGRTKKEIETTFNTSSHFIKNPIDYRGDYITDTTKYRRKVSSNKVFGEIVGESSNTKMLRLTGSDIQLTRGDNATFNIEININGSSSNYQRVDGDKLTFTLKKSYNSSSVLVQKDIEGMIINLEPSDTSDLKYGTYWYDVQLTTNEGQVYTVIGPSRFEIREEVTF